MATWTGLRHFIHEAPKFGRNQDLYKKNPDFLPTQAKERNVYVFWYEFLKRSNAYKEVCDTKGEKGNAKLRKLYADFGDVHGSNFREWWRTHDRGATLFAEDRPENIVKRISNKDELIEDDAILNVQIPLEFSKRDIIRLVNHEIRKHHKGKRGQRKTDKDSTAQYKVRGRVNYSALQKALYVYDEVLKKELTGKTFWQIGNTPLVVKNVISQGEISKNKSLKRQYMDATKQNRQTVVTETDDKIQLITSTVNRLFKRAQKLIKSAELGSFPRS